MKSRPLPSVGLILLGLVLALLGALFALMVLEGEEGGWLPRLLVSAVAIVSLVAAEAVWWVRPWLARAIDAWALTCVLAVLATIVAVAVHDGSSMSGFLLMVTLVICFVGMPCALIRWYVRSHPAMARLLAARRPVPKAAP